MNNNKEGFVIYKEMCRVVLDLSDEELGKVFRWIIQNRLGENDIKEPNGNLKMVIGFFKNQFRLDDVKYDEFVEKQRENGLKGGRPKEPKEPKPYLDNPTEPKKPYKEKEKEKEKVKDKDNISKDIYVYFESFWKLYPRKIEKKEAKEVYLKLVKADPLLAQKIADGLDKQLPVFAKTETQFIPHPTTWLRGARWEDDLSINQPKKWM